MSTLVHFPKRFRHPLPADARPNHRERFVEIFPSQRGGWSVYESDEGGGWAGTFATKVEALAAAMYWLDDGDAVLRVYNLPLPECGP
jgi:hypothetical protein